MFAMSYASFSCDYFHTVLIPFMYMYHQPYSCLRYDWFILSPDLLCYILAIVKIPTDH